ncbi:class I SAM-dependent methyltransferase [Marininema halotolerans]|nr:class I SAM-dependent methyltransferase [Marininema halotolerans]
MNEKIRLTKEKEMLLMTLYGRAQESRKQEPIIKDHDAEDIIEKIDYDFSKLTIYRGDTVTIAIRAKYLDQWTKEFLSDHPKATVIHLACGLDSRINRVQVSDTVAWYDIDYPEVIELRRQFYEERSHYHMIGSSVVDPEWLSQIPTENPVLIIAEGLTMYLHKQEVYDLFQRLSDRFSTGQVAFDALNPFATRWAKFRKMTRTTGATFHWALKKPEIIEEWVPRFHLMKQLNLFEAPEIRQLPQDAQQVFLLFQKVPWLKKMTRLFLYRFE